MSDGTDLRSVRMRASDGDRHVSGAETVVPRDRAAERAAEMVDRALDHERGDPGEVRVTVERLSTDPERVRALPVEHVAADGVEVCRAVAAATLADAGVEPPAVERGFEALAGETAARGAALVGRESGDRRDPDPERGVRATRLGATARGERRLADLLAAEGLADTRLDEALVLATKATRAPGVVAELCRSDNPDYTTGYVATAEAYVRLPALKRAGDPTGGRALFLDPEADVAETVTYLRERPVVVDEVAGFRRVDPASRLGSDPDG